MSRHDRSGLLGGARARLRVDVRAAPVAQTPRATDARRDDGRRALAAVDERVSPFRGSRRTHVRVLRRRARASSSCRRSTSATAAASRASRPGAQELKLTRRVGNRSYESGGVRAATGLRLLTFFFADEAALSARFVQHGLAGARVHGLSRRGPPHGARAGSRRPGRRARDRCRARRPSSSASIEVGLTVADLERSRAFYREFVGLEELPPVRRRAFRYAQVFVPPRRDDDQPAQLRQGPSGRHRQRRHPIRRVGRRIRRCAREGAARADRSTAERLARLRSANDLARRPGRGHELLRRDGREPRGARRDRPTAETKSGELLRARRWNGSTRRPPLRAPGVQTPMAVLIAAFCFVTNCSKLCSAGFSLRVVSALRFASICLSKSR